MRLIEYIGACGEMLVARLGPGGRMGPEEVAQWDHHMAASFNHGHTPAECVARWFRGECA